MHLRSRLKRLVPARLYNSTILSLPVLYTLPFIHYESNLSRDGIDDLLGLLDQSVRLPGDIAECGSSRCGTTVLMAKHLQRSRVDKRIYAFDSFEGFDQQELAQAQAMGQATSRADAFTSTNVNYVRQKIDKLGLGESITPVPGFFQQTLPGFVKSTPVCFAFIDCDLQESMTFCAETLWPRLQPGGTLAFDDYLSDEFKGARLAVDRFVNARKNEIASHSLLRRIYYARKKDASS